MKKIRDIEPYIIDCMVLKFTPTEALDYLHSKGFKLKQRTYYDKRKQIEDSRFMRLAKIAESGFVDQHLERIHNLEMVNQEMWKRYNEKDYEAMSALRHIMELQPYLSAFYDASKRILEDNVKQNIDKNRQQEADNSIPVVQ